MSAPSVASRQFRIGDRVTLKCYWPSYTCGRVIATKHKFACVAEVIALRVQLDNGAVVTGLPKDFLPIGF